MNIVLIILLMKPIAIFAKSMDKTHHQEQLVFVGSKNSIQEILRWRMRSGLVVLNSADVQKLIEMIDEDPFCSSLPN